MPVDFKTVLNILDRGNWLSLSYVTANREKKTGGEVITLRKCRIAKHRVPRSNQKKPAMSKKELLEDNKDPNHNYHFTRNVELPNGEIRKIRPLLIFNINGEYVV